MNHFCNLPGWCVWPCISTGTSELLNVRKNDDHRCKGQTPVHSMKACAGGCLGDEHCAHT